MINYDSVVLVGRDGHGEVASLTFDGKSIVKPDCEGPDDDESPDWMIFESQWLLDELIKFQAQGARSVEDEEGQVGIKTYISDIASIVKDMKECPEDYYI